MPGLSVEPRKQFSAVQKRLAARGGGTSAIIFDQVKETDINRSIDAQADKLFVYVYQNQS